MVTYHVGRFQVFNHDGLIAVYIMARGFMQGIFTLISNAFVMTRYVVLGFLASAASLLTLSKLTLSMSQLLRTRLRMFGVLNDMAIAISYEIPDTHIQPHSIVFLGQGGRFGLADALEVPTRRTQDDTSKLEGTFKRSVDDTADTTATELRRMEVLTMKRTSSISELDGIPGIGALEAREADCASFFASLEEIGKRAVKTFEGGIHNHSRQIRVSLFAMMLILLIEMHVLARLFVVSDKFKKTGIVHLARGYQHTHQGLLLLLIRAHPILKRSHAQIVARFDYIVKARAKAEIRLTTGARSPVACGGLKPFSVILLPIRSMISLNE